MPRAVSYTIQDPTTADVKSLTITRQSNGAGAFVLVCTAYYELRDATGAVVVTGTVSTQLNASQASAIGSFVTSNVLPLIVTQEGL